MASLSLVLPSGDSDASDEVFETAPSSPQRPLYPASSPEEHFSLPASPIITPISMPETPRRKNVTWSPLPPKMDRTDHTPRRTTSTPQLHITAAISLPLPRTPTAPLSPSSFATPMQQERDQNLSWPFPIRSPQQGRHQTFLSQPHAGESPQQARRYELLPGIPILPLDICAGGFLKTKKFEVICALAMHTACMIPTDPPPQAFVSLNITPMHPWFESLVAVFTECFAKRLRDRNAFPQKPVVYTGDGNITIEEDHIAFECELVAHVNAIFRSFNTNWGLRALGSYDNLFIDTTQSQADMAGMVIREITEKASFPPKANWKVGETLHPFYKAQLRRFRGGVMRIIEDRPDDSWILTEPEQLERGVAGYEEYYIAHVRHKILVHNGEA